MQGTMTEERDKKPEPFRSGSSSPPSRTDTSALKAAAGLEPYRRRLPDLRPDGKKWRARCPFHDDHQPSLEIEEKNGAFLHHCFPCKEGGDVIKFVKKADQIAFPDALRVISNECGIPLTEEKPEVFKYDRETAKTQLPEAERYLTSRGITLEVAASAGLGVVEHPRLGRAVAMPYPNGAVKLRALQPKDGRKWSHANGATADQLFGIESLEDPFFAPEVYVTESELDSLTLRTLGLNAVSVSSATACFEHGRLKILPELLAKLADYDEIHLAFDRDEAGRLCAEAFQRALPTYKVFTLIWPFGGKNSGDPKDVGELFAQDPTTFAERFAKSAEEARRYRTVGTFKYEPLNLDEFLAKKIPVPEPLVGPILRQKHIMEIYSWRGLGKTFVSTGMALALSSATPFLKWEVKTPQRVLYVDGEMDGHEFQERLRALRAGTGKDIDPSYFYPMNFDSQTYGMTPDIATPDGQRVIEDMIGRCDAQVLVLDNLSCLARISDNDDEAWIPVSQWLLELRRRGITTIFDHHAGKNGNQRGTSRREDPVNTVIKLERPEDWEPEDGLHCVLKFEKSRGFKGADAEPLDIRLIGDGQGGLTWSWALLLSEQERKFKELMEAGMPKQDIIETMKISRPTYYRLKKRLNQKAEKLSWV